MAAALEDRLPMTDRELTAYWEPLNLIEGAVVAMRTALHRRDRDAVERQLANPRASIEEQLTRMETASLSWSPQSPCPLRSLKEMHQAGLLPIYRENTADNG